MAKGSDNVISGVAVALSAKTKAFDDGINKSLKNFKNFASQASSIASKIGGVGTAMAATFGGALLLARKNSAELTAATKELNASFAALNTEIATALAPVMVDLANGIRRVLEGWYSLNPEVRASIVEWGAMFATVSVGLVAFSKFATLATGLTEGLLFLRTALVGVTQALIPVSAAGKVALLPLLKIVAVVALVALAAGALYRTWKTHGDAIKEVFARVVDQMVEWGRAIGSFFGGVWDGIKAVVMTGITFLLEQFASFVRRLAKMALPIAELLGLDSMSSVLRDASNLSGAKLLDGIKTGAELLVDGAVFAGKKIAEGVTFAAGGLKDAGKDLLGMAKGLLGGGDGVIPQAPGTGPAKSIFRSSAEIATLKRQREMVKALQQLAKPSPVEKALERMKEAEAKRMKELEKERLKLRADFWGGVDGKTGQASGLVGQALGSLGTAGNVATGAMQGAAVAGPLGAVAGGAMALLGETKSLERLLQGLQPVVTALVGIVDAVLAPIITALEPAFTAIAMLLQGLAPVLSFLSTGLQALDPVIRGLSWVVMKIQEGITRVTAWLVDAAAWLVGWINSDLGDQLRSQASSLRSNADALNQAAKDLWKPTKDVAKEMQKAADSMDTSNLPAIWRSNLRMLQSLDFGQRQPQVYVDVTLDGRGIARSVETRTERRSALERGTIGRPGRLVGGLV